MALILDISETDPRPTYPQIMGEIGRGQVVESVTPEESLPPSDIRPWS